jgi:hypothetical protein
MFNCSLCQNFVLEGCKFRSSEIRQYMNVFSNVSRYCRIRLFSPRKSSKTTSECTIRIINENHSPVKRRKANVAENFCFCWNGLFQSLLVFCISSKKIERWLLSKQALEWCHSTVFFSKNNVQCLVLIMRCLKVKNKEKEWKQHCSLLSHLIDENKFAINDSSINQCISFAVCECWFFILYDNRLRFSQHKCQSVNI